MAEKSFKPSKKRLEDARKKGKVLKSQMLTQAVVFLAVIIAFFVILSATWVRNRMLLEYFLVEGYHQPLSCLLEIGRLLLKVIAGGLIFGGATSIIIEAVQVGVKFEPTLLKPKASNFNPAGGIKKAVTGLKQAWLKILSVLCLFVITWWFFRRFSSLIPHVFYASAEQKLAVFKEVFLFLLAGGCLCLIVVGVLEYLVKRRNFYRELSMSHEEVRREHKESEGDPLVKAVRRSQHEALLRQDIVSRVRKAKVIVVEDG